MFTDQILFYKTDDGLPAIEVTLVNDTVWLTQKQIAEVFGTRVPAISKHISNIFKSGSLILQLFPKWKQFKRKEAGK